MRSAEEPGDRVIIIYVHTRTLDADALPKKALYNEGNICELK